jgi:capsular polysaccharide biosynthesis protein
MDLILYWKIIAKRWWLPVILVATVGLVTGLTYRRPPQLYTTTFKLNVGLAPAAQSGSSDDSSPLDTWRASEYLMDDLSAAVRGSDYARRVAQRLDSEGINLAGAFSSATDHRVLSVSITWSDPDQLSLIANAAIAVLEQEAADLVGPLGESKPVLPLIDPPVIVPVGRSLKDKLDIPIRLGLALVAGIAGTYLLDYLDTSIRDRDEVERMGIPILAEIPKHKS